MENPFEAAQPVGDRFFVDRSTEVATLTQHLRSRRNVLLVAPRQT